MKNKFCRDLLALFLLVVLSLQIPAQQRTFKVGDVLPEDFWTTTHPMVNSPQKTSTFGENRDKLILLDFWATWCSACLKNFPKMEALEKQFEGKVKVLAVSYESRALLEKFFLSKNGQRFKNIVSVSDAKILNEAFPHFGIPFVVWIQDGKVLNTTDANQVTEEAIKEALESRKSSIQTVIHVNNERPLMLAEQFDLERETSLLSYELLSKGRIRAIPPGNKMHVKDGITYGRRMANMTVLKMYQAIAYELFKERGDAFSAKRLVNLVKDPTKLEFLPQDSSEEVGQKLYSFEFIGPMSQATSLHSRMLDALNRNSDYEGTLQVQRHKSLVLNLNPKQVVKYNSARSKVKTEVQRADLVVSSLNQMPITRIPILLESGSDILIPIEIYNLNDFEAIKNAFKDAGFDVQEKEKEILMLVLQDQNSLRN